MCERYRNHVDPAFRRMLFVQPLPKWELIITISGSLVIPNTVVRPLALEISIYFGPYLLHIWKSRHPAMPLMTPFRWLSKRDLFWCVLNAIQSIAIVPLSPSAWLP